MLFVGINNNHLALIGQFCSVQYGIIFNMIELKNVYKTYEDGTRVLHGINLNIDDGEFAYIIGPTGSGKTTLIKLLDGEEVPTRGDVLVSNINVGKIKKSKVYKYRRIIGVVFQDYKLLLDKKS